MGTLKKKRNEVFFKERADPLRKEVQSLERLETSLHKKEEEVRQTGFRTPKEEIDVQVEQFT